MRNAFLVPMMFAVAVVSTTAHADFYEPAGPLGSLVSRAPPCLFAARTANSAEPPCVPPLPDATVSARERVTVLLQRADGFLVNQDQASAARSARMAVEADPASADAWHYSARVELTFGNMDAARFALDKALALDPKHSNALATSGHMLAMAGRPREALKVYAAALQSDPKNRFALVDRIYLLEDLRDAKALAKDLEALAMLAPEHPIVAKYRMVASLAQDDPAAALREVDRALQREPGAYHLLVQRVNLLHALGDHAGAEQVFATLLGGSRESPRYAIGGAEAGRLHFARALNLHALKRGSDARRSVTEALALADPKLVLVMQVFLRDQGYKDVTVTGTASPELEAALASCMQNVACGRGLATKI